MAGLRLADQRGNERRDDELTALHTVGSWVLSHLPGAELALSFVLIDSPRPLVKAENWQRNSRLCRAARPFLCLWFATCISVGIYLRRSNRAVNRVCGLCWRRHSVNRNWRLRLHNFGLPMSTFRRLQVGHN
jgi:hypothetical protein